MAPDEPTFGPLQLLVVAFETTDRFDGEIARELRDLRGRGLIRVVDARLLSRGEDGELTEIDLNELIGDPAGSEWRPAAHLFGFNGRGPIDGDGSPRTPELYARTTGFTLEDLRRLTDEIGAGEHAAMVLVEHAWAARLRRLIRERGGHLLAQGLLTPEVTMIVGAEMQAKADAEAAIELADAARGAALLEALERFADGTGTNSIEDRSRGAAQVVRVLVENGFLHEPEAEAAVDALVTAGLIESALVQAAVAEAQDAVGDEREDHGRG